MWLGVQETVLKACASGAKNATSDKISQRGATFVVPNESQHTMVDDVGGMMVDKYAHFEYAEPSCMSRA